MMVPSYASFIPFVNCLIAMSQSYFIWNVICLIFFLGKTKKTKQKRRNRGTVDMEKQTKYPCNWSTTINYYNTLLKTYTIIIHHYTYIYSISTSGLTIVCAAASASASPHLESRETHHSESKQKKNKQSPNFHLPFFKSLLIIASPFTFTSPTTTHRKKKSREG
jgi:hypothetical protein